LPLGPILVHVLTACGVVCALMATLAVADARFEAMFIWLALAFVIDGASAANGSISSSTT
jgi:phosphatidylserine synthase